MGILLAIHGSIAQGLLWGVLALGVYISFRVLDFADLTVDGSFACGAAVSATLICKGFNPFLTLIFSFLVGAVCGCVTGLLHTKLKIDAILAGILTQLGLYSINLLIMGQANVPLLGEETIFSLSSKAIGGRLSSNNVVLIFGIAINAIIILLMYWFFGTEIGSAVRATGNNKHMVRALGVSTDNTIILGLALSNGLVALSGGLVANHQSYADIQMGIGSIVIALASVILGEVFFGKKHSFWFILCGAVFGSVLYRIIIAVVLQLGLNTNNLKLLTAVLVAFALALPVISEKTNRLKKKKLQSGNN